ncbi:MAG: hypothetical protein J5860_04360, partial [Clostridia bacterium]|nr:hypothetical protein [Clostridia bacterium]
GVFFPRSANLSAPIGVFVLYCGEGVYVRTIKRVTALSALEVRRHVEPDVLAHRKRHRSRRRATCRSILFRTFSFTLKEKVHKGVFALSRDKRSMLQEKRIAPQIF